MRLYVHAWGDGPPVVLVHGWVLGGREAWRAQRPLTERWRLLAPDMPGHGASPPGRQDAGIYAELLAEQLLDEPVHLVGHSHGGIVAMLAAARRPRMIRSLTVVEPPATRVVIDDPVVSAWDAELRQLCADADTNADTDADLAGLLRRFFALAGVSASVPEPLPTPLATGARAIRGARPPGDIEVPLEPLADAPFEMLVVSGGHLEPFETICDDIAARTGAQREVIRGAAHMVHETGAPFNARLERFFECRRWGSNPRPSD